MVIFEDRGKQYKVKTGDLLKLPKLSQKKPKDKVQFSKIIFYKNDKGETVIGSPYIEQIVVEASVVSQVKDKKIIVFKKKRRHNYRRKIGHRQELTLVKIEKIGSSLDINKAKPVKNSDEITKKSVKSKGDK